MHFILNTKIGDELDKKSNSFEDEWKEKCNQDFSFKWWHSR